VAELVLLILACGLLVGTLQALLVDLSPGEDFWFWLAICAFYTLGFGVITFGVPALVA
jgi:hypothetical protein